MLVLSRKVNETIKIGDYITITVVRIGSEHVKLGISAPVALPVTRPDAKRQTPREDQ